MTRKLWTVYFMGLLLALYVALSGTAARGATNVTWTWDAPTNYVDGSAVSPGTPISYRVEWGRGNWTQEVVSATNEQRISHFEPGTYWYRVAGIAAGTTGLVSDAASWTWELKLDKPRNWRRK